MSYTLPQYKEPDFTKEPFVSAPDVKTIPVSLAGVAPEGFHATTIFPEYIKVNGKWLLAKESRMDCVLVLGSDNTLEVKEFRRLLPGDRVVVGRTEMPARNLCLSLWFCRKRRARGNFCIPNRENQRNFLLARL